MVAIARYQIHSMTEADISQVADIEAESFPTTWPRTAYRRELNNRLARYLVVVDSEHEPVTQPERRRSILRALRHSTEPPPTTEYIVGYVGVWLMVDEAHIVAIAVREAFRRRGLGELLLVEAIEMALANRQESMSLEVRRSNVGAQALYDKYHFLKVGVRRRYYSDNGEDAIIMSTPPIQDESFRHYLAYLKEQWQKRWESEGAESDA
jgi:[ribosomal protein S18]-alanine N-acetyltransferase